MIYKLFIIPLGFFSICSLPNKRVLLGNTLKETQSNLSYHSQSLEMIRGLFEHLSLQQYWNVFTEAVIGDVLTRVVIRNCCIVDVDQVINIK